MDKINVRNEKDWSGVKKAVIMFIPSVILLGGFFIGPALVAMIYSMTDMTLTGASAQTVHFVGFENFAALFHSPGIGTVVYNTVIFLFVSGILGQQVLGLFLALLLREKRRGVKFFVGVTVAAGWITPEVVAIVMFSCVFAANGTANMLLGMLGIEPVQWLIKHALASVVIANIWKGCAYSVMMFQAALDQVSDDILEAARIDGAGSMQILFRIIIPTISSALVTDFMVVTLGTLGTVGLIYGMTGGGPGNSSTTLSMLMYKKAFTSFQLGYGMAIAVVILVAGRMLSMGYTKLVDKNK